MGSCGGHENAPLRSAAVGECEGWMAPAADLQDPPPRLLGDHTSTGSSQPVTEQGGETKADPVPRDAGLLQ